MGEQNPAVGLRIELSTVADVRKRDVGRAFTKIKAANLYQGQRDARKASVASRAHQFMVGHLPLPSHCTSDSCFSLCGVYVQTRFCSLSKLPPSVEKAATHISMQIDRLGFLNAAVAATVAGVSIYLATQLAKDTRWRRTFTRACPSLLFPHCSLWSEAFTLGG